MSNQQVDQDAASEPMSTAKMIASYLRFLQDAHTRLKQALVSKDAAEVLVVRAAIEEHYSDDQGQPAMYQKFESALYDDARSMVTLWQLLEEYPREELVTFQHLTALEIDGLSGDRHPRKVFDRSPFGIGALVVGTITIWMTFFRTYTGDDEIAELLELIRFNAIAGLIWIVGLFVVLWFILKTVRNNRQVAFLATVARSLDLYLRDR